MIDELAQNLKKKIEMSHSGVSGSVSFDEIAQYLKDRIGMCDLGIEVTEHTTLDDAHMSLLQMFADHGTHIAAVDVS